MFVREDVCMTVQCTACLPCAKPCARQWQQENLDLVLELFTISSRLDWHIGKQ